MRHTFEIYPEYHDNEDKPLYFIEFSRWKQRDELTWQLFKRNFIHSKEEWDELVKASPGEAWMLGRECHPWNLGEGVVMEDERCVSMNTKSFLKFLVDSLNKNT